MSSSTYIRTVVRRVEHPAPEDCARLDRMMTAFGCGVSFFTRALLTTELRDSLVRQHPSGAHHKYYLRDRLVAILGVPGTRSLKSKRAFDTECRRLKANGEVQLAKLAKKLYRGVGKRFKSGTEEPVMMDVLQARMWKLSFEEAMQIVGTYWTTLSKAVIKLIMKKDGWDENQRHYACWLMMSDRPQFFALMSKPISDSSLDPIALNVPSFAAKVIKDRTKIASTVKRLLSDVRKSGRIQPPSGRPRNNRVTFDACCWKLVSTEKNRQTISVMGMVPATKRNGCSRISLNLKGIEILRGTLEMMRVGGEYLINVCETVDALTPPKDGKRVGADRGFTEVVADSDGHFFGKGLGEEIAEYSEKSNKKNQQRNPLYALKRSYEKSSSAKRRRKARHILKHNLGNTKQRKALARFRARIACLVNHACNQFFKTHKNCKELVLEDLSHAMTPHYSKKMNRKLSNWVRGYIVERIMFHAAKRGIAIITVNAAYSSRVCPVCHSFAKENRKGDLFHCSECGARAHADVLAAWNLLDRSYDTEITTEMRKEEVAKVLEGRHRRLEDSSIP